MARSPRGRNANAKHDERVVGEIGNQIRIMIDDETIVAWDASALEPSARMGIAQRIAHYANSQVMGLPKVK